MPASPSSRPIAYLTGEYPAVSHTFILREVLALRALGREVVTCSIRKTGPEHHRGPDEKEAAATTFNVLEAARDPGRLLPALGAALSRPGAFFRALGLMWRLRPPGIKALIWQIFYLVEAIVLAHHLKQRNVVQIHNHFAMASSSVAMLASELSGIPFSFTLHGPADFQEVKRWRLDAKIARARLVACISHFCRSQAMMYSGLADWPKLRIIHCGVDPARYGNAPDDQPGRRILFVGRLAAAKGVPVLLEAFAAARGELAGDGPPPELILVGDGPERPQIEAYAGDLGLGEAVRFTGYLSQGEVADQLARSDLFALPSFAEGVPVVLMEAMAARRPVLTTRIAGIPELVEDGVSGRIVAPGDAESLAEAMVDMLRDPERAREYGKAGREKVRQDFDVAAEAARLDRLFDDPLADQPGRP